MIDSKMMREFDLRTVGDSTWSVLVNDTTLGFVRRLDDGTFESRPAWRFFSKPPLLWHRAVASLGPFYARSEFAAAALLVDAVREQS